MFVGEVGRVILAMLKFLGFIISFQLFVYWVIDKYTKVNLSLGYRITLTVIITISIVCLMYIIATK